VKRSQYSSGGLLSVSTLVSVMSFPLTVTFRIVRAANVRGSTLSRSSVESASKSGGYCRYVTSIVSFLGSTVFSFVVGSCRSLLDAVRSRSLLDAVRSRLLTCVLLLLLECEVPSDQFVSRWFSRCCSPFFLLLWWLFVVVTFETVWTKYSSSILCVTLWFVRFTFVEVFSADAVEFTFEGCSLCLSTD